MQQLKYDIENDGDFHNDLQSNGTPWSCGECWGQQLQEAATRLCCCTLRKKSCELILHYFISPKKKKGWGWGGEGNYLQTWESICFQTNKKFDFQKCLAFDFLWTPIKVGNAEHLTHKQALANQFFQLHLLSRSFVSLAWISELHAPKQVLFSSSNNQILFCVILKALFPSEMCGLCYLENGEAKLKREKQHDTKL